MKLGVVKFNYEITVDMDDPEMVQHGIDCFYEDVMNAYKYDELNNMIEVEEREGLHESDIPEFLKPTCDECMEILDVCDCEQ
ncbi:MAG: hypothetical protein ACXADH_12740 [Candidatus Kariarchaeaceae archaeon]|jgi:hypothetical protein